ncbi:MAG: fibrinogen-like YCDxxxxGGGW domain-containing protein [Flavobacteriales bacterium]
MKNTFLSLSFLLGFSAISFAQNGMSVGTNTAPLEMLDVNGAIRIGSDFIGTTGAPAGGKGTIRWNDTDSRFEGWDGSTWVLLSSGAGTDDQDLTGATLTGSSLQIDIESGSSTTVSLADLEESADIAAVASDLADHETDDGDLDDSNEIQNLGSSASGTDRTITISGGTGTTISVADNDNSATNEIQTAAQVAITPAGNLAADDVQEALQELQTDIDGIAPTIEDVLTNGSVAADGQSLKIDKVAARDADGLSLTDDGSNGIFIEDGGNVGVNNTSPDAPLTLGDGTNGNAYFHLKRSDNPHINLFEGTTSVARIQGDIVTYNSVAHNQFQITKANGTSPVFVVNQDDGFVGVGTTTPQSQLHISSSSTDAAPSLAQFLRPTMTTTQANYIKLGKELSNGNAADIIFNWKGNNDPDNYLGFSFYGGGTPPLAVTVAGNVGVGNTSPDEKFHVNGTIRSTDLAGATDPQPVYATTDGNLVPASDVTATTKARNCWELKLLNPLSPSGTYTIDPDGSGPLPTIDCYCDMVTDGGGWTLVLNYLHRGGTNPALSVLTNRLPIQAGTTLGTNESGSSTAWGHAKPSYLKNFVMRELRFTGRSGGHGRVIDFVFSAEALKYARTGTGKFDYINAQYSSRTLPNHTAAYLPFSANGFYTNQGDYALTAFPFYRGGTGHWGIRASSRWEVDDNAGSAQHTWHQVWIR